MARKSRRMEQVAHLQNNGSKCTLPEIIVEEAPSSTSLPSYKVGIYGRLSVKDLGIDDGDTMDTQISLLRDYVIQQPDMELTEVYIDNGWTGTNFQRPEFIHMMDDVKAGKINCIVVKDLSRLGRNYLEAGYYLQEVFPGYNLRFIAIYDGFDSLTSDPESMLIGTKNIINDYYSKDISKKISATIDIKRSQGPHYLGIVPYGYIMSDGDDRKFVIDTTVAPFVRLLFDWVLEGHSFVDIARNLNDMNVPTPKQHYYDRNNGMGHQKLAEVDPNACWNSAMVRNIALNRTYTGDFVYFKSYHRKYDLANSRDIPEEEWLIYPDSHEAYISHDKYQRIRTMIEQRQNRRSYNASRKNIQIINKENPFSKLLFCGECRRQIRFQKNYANLNKSSYYCSGNSTYSHHGHAPLRMEYRKLLDIVRFHIQLQINVAIEIEEFLNRISLEETKKQLKLSRQNIVRNLTAKQAQIKNRKQRAYEDLSNHLLDQETYQLQKEKLDREAHWLEGDIARARQRVLDVDHYFTMDNEWLQTVLSVRYSEEIDSRVIHLLISKIEIYRENQIHIIYNCADWMEKLQSCVNEIKREG
ncbi:recombinase family protein [Mediterraneibacter faecis]